MKHDETRMGHGHAKHGEIQNGPGKPNTGKRGSQTSGHPSTQPAGQRNSYPETQPPPATSPRTPGSGPQPPVLSLRSPAFTAVLRSAQNYHRFWRPDKISGYYISSKWTSSMFANNASVCSSAMEKTSYRGSCFQPASRWPLAEETEDKCASATRKTKCLHTQLSHETAWLNSVEEPSRLTLITVGDVQTWLSLEHAYWILSTDHDESARAWATWIPVTVLVLPRSSVSHWTAVTSPQCWPLPTPSLLLPAQNVAKSPSTTFDG